MSTIIVLLPIPVINIINRILLNCEEFIIIISFVKKGFFRAIAKKILILNNLSVLVSLHLIRCAKTQRLIILRLSMYRTLQ